MRKTLLALAIMIMPIYFSCKSNKEVKDCKTCKVAPPDQKIIVKVAGVDRDFNVWTGGNRSKRNLNYSFATNPITSSRHELLEAAAFYGLDLTMVSEGKDLACIVFYSKANLDKKELQRDDLLGALVYTGDAEKFYVQEYVVADAKFVQLKELNSISRYITSNDIRTGSTIFKYNSNIIAFRILDADKLTKKTTRQNSFGHNVIMYLGAAKLGMHLQTLGFENLEHGGYGCEDPCITNPEGACVVDLISSICEPTCYYNDNLQYSDYDENSDPWKPTFHNFRDKILTGSAVGQHFIADFKYCSSILAGNVKPSIAYQAFAIYDSHIILITNKLLDVNASVDTSIIFNAGDATKIKNFVDSVATLSTDSLFLAIIDEVKANIDYAKGKTVAQIYYDLK